MPKWNPEDVAANEPHATEKEAQQLTFCDATLKPWQAKLHAKITRHITEHNDYNIIVVVDHVGLGMSFYMHWACNSVPNVHILRYQSPVHMMKYLIANKAIKGNDATQHTLLLDVTHEDISKTKWETLVAGLDAVKQGFLADRRANEKICEPFVVAVFCNKCPPAGCATEGKLQIYQMEELMAPEIEMEPGPIKRTV